MAKVTATIRMYRFNELGDCFLVTFKSGQKSSRMLIDCGSFQNSDASKSRLNEITNRIAADLDGEPLDVVVGTHQHNDHVSGFVHCKHVFANMKVQQVWLSWLDDPKDKQAQRIGKKHHNLMLALARARDILDRRVKGPAATGPIAERSLVVLDDILGFYGAKGANAVPELPAIGIANLKKLGAKDPQYLEPGQTLSMPGLPADTVRVHILGPPRTEADLNRRNPRQGETYDHALASNLLLADQFLAANKRQDGEAATDRAQYPFKQSFERRPTRPVAAAPKLSALDQVVNDYDDPAISWRKIDEDWLRQSESLALYLDTYTNNSSLALAIELVASGKVLLFAADAQSGNWASWKTVKWNTPGVTTDDLLARTVFYKVGHHASHNATLVEVFEKMIHDDLVALIPVHKKDPNIDRPKGWKMPAKNLFKRLVAKTKNRVLQMDGVNPTSCDPEKEPAKSAWKQAGIKPRVTNEAIEVEIRG